MSKPIKVTVSATITVDPDAWALAYGTSTDRTAVTDDVRSYVLNELQGLAPVDEGGFLHIVVKGA